MFQLYVGDLAPSIPGHFAINGVEVDLTALVVTFSMRNRDTGVLKVDHQTVTKLPGVSAGSCQYDWHAGDTDTEGTYDAWMEALVTGSRIQTLELGQVHVDQHGAVTLTDVRELVETGLSDTALQVLLDDATQSVYNLVGAPGAKVITRDAFGVRTLMLPSPAQSIILVEERPTFDTGSVWVTTDPANYELEDGGRTLRKIYGTGGWWGDGWDSLNGNGAWWSRRTRVTYLPLSDVAVRRRVIIDLVRLATQYSGLSAEKIGTYSASPLDFQNERERLLKQLTSATSKLRFA